MMNTALPLDLCRKTIVRQQKLQQSQDESVVQIVRHLCGIQYDPNPQISQSHYLVLWNRVPEFTEEDLDRAAYQQFDVIEGTFMRRNRFFVPTDEFHTYRQATRSVVRWGNSIAAIEQAATVPQAATVQYRVLDCLANYGPLSRQDLFSRLGWLETYKKLSARSQSGQPLPINEWVLTPLGALRLLEWQGRVITADRRPGPFRQPLYMAVEALPVTVWLGDTPTEQEAQKKLVTGVVKSFGVVTASCVGYLTGFGTRHSTTILTDIARSCKYIQKYRIDGVCRAAVWGWSHALEQASCASSWEQVSLLSPMDNLVRDRKYLASMFNYSFQFEYFQKKNMRWQLSVLIGDRFAGYIDCRRDHKQAALQVRETTLTETDKRKSHQRLQQLAHYHNCRHITFEEVQR